MLLHSNLYPFKPLQRWSADGKKWVNKDAASLNSSKPGMRSSVGVDADQLGLSGGPHWKIFCQRRPSGPRQPEGGLPAVRPVNKEGRQTSGAFAPKIKKKSTEVTQPRLAVKGVSAPILYGMLSELVRAQLQRLIFPLQGVKKQILLCSFAISF